MLSDIDFCRGQPAITHGRPRWATVTLCKTWRNENQAGISVKLILNPQLRKTFFHSLNPASQQGLGRFPDFRGGKNEK
jgi:hypothetical protein